MRIARASEARRGRAERAPGGPSVNGLVRERVGSPHRLEEAEIRPPFLARFVAQDGDPARRHERQLEDLPLLVADTPLLRADAPFLPDDDDLATAGDLEVTEAADPPVMPVEFRPRFPGLCGFYAFGARLADLVPVPSGRSSLLRGLRRGLGLESSPPC